MTMVKVDAEKKMLENYGDAQFSLLMYYFSQAEGEKLLEENESLKNDSSFAVPDDIDRRCSGTINKEYAKSLAKHNFLSVKRVLNKVAIVLLAVGIVFVTLFGCASAFRAKVLNFFYSNLGYATGISLNDENIQNSSGTASSQSPQLTWLPEGYILTNSANTENDGDYFEYTNTGGNRIVFTCMKGSAVGFNVDTENADYVEETTVMGYSGIFFIKGTRQTVVWGDTENDYLYEIIADNISKDEMNNIISHIE